MRARIHLKGHGSDVRCQRASRKHRARPRRLMRNDHPRTSVEQIGICGTRTAALTTCHGMRTDVTRGFLETSLTLQAAQHIGYNRVLHGGNIGDDRVGET